MPLVLQLIKRVMPVPNMIGKKEKERDKGKFHGHPDKAAVPGQDSEQQDRSRERDRKCKTAKCAFQGRVDRNLKQGKHSKPADDKKELLFS
jgi:hypothetical protein